MRFNNLLLAVASCAVAQKILLTNDDGWVSTNIRAAYHKLKEAGHDVLLVAPAVDKSGSGGQFEFPAQNTLEANGDFDYIKAGAPAWGHETDDHHVWYFNGTPAACVAFALNYVEPFYFKNSTTTFDLVVAGPNEDNNASPALFTVSGTMGAAYNAVYRGIPAVAFSGYYQKHSFFAKHLALNDTSAPATIYANLVVDLVESIFEAQGDLPLALPLGTGLSVNFPAVGSDDANCTNPKWVPSRLTGAYARGWDLVYNATSDSIEWTLDVVPFAGDFVCHNGDCSLPSENAVLNDKCTSPVSVFSIDYDANTQLQQQVSGLFKHL